GATLTVGAANVDGGFAGSRVVKWGASDQMPDYLAAVTINITGKLDLNGFDETIGNLDGQTALTINSGIIDTGEGTLTIHGNIVATGATGAGLWTPEVAARISGNLDLGGVVTTIDIADRSPLAADLIIDADISGTGGFNKVGTGVLLLSGNNTYSGATYLTAGHLAMGSDTAFGVSNVYLPTTGTSLLAYDGTRVLGNTTFAGAVTINLVGGNNIGGGGNAIVFAGPVNLTSGTTTFNVAIAGTAEFLGGIGETFGASNLSKSGFGTLVISSAATYSGATTINQNGGAIVLTDQGALYNTSSITINTGGELVVNNQIANKSNRVSDVAGITLSGGTLTLIGKEGEASAESFGIVLLSDNSSSAIHSVVSTTAGSEAEWHFESLDRGEIGQLGGEFVRFVGRGQVIGASGGNRVSFTVAPSRMNGIIDIAVIDNASTGLNFATHHTAGRTTGSGFFGLLDVYDATTAALPELVALGGTFANTLAGAIATTNVRLNSSKAISGPITANALLLADGSIVVSGAHELTLASGLIASNGTGSSITVDTLTLNGLTSNIYVNDHSDLTVSSGVGGTAGQISEIQRFTLGGTPTDASTTFTLTFSGQTTAAITWSATAATTASNIQSALEALGNIGAGNVSVVANSTLNFDIFFQGTLANLNVANMTTALVNAAGATSQAVNEVIAGNPGVLGKQGTGTLTFDGTNPNTFGGTARINEGTLIAAKDTAFGVATGDVIVSFGASVGLSGGLNIAAETLTLFGNGESNTAAARPLRNLDGTNTWQGNVVLGTNRTAMDIADGSELIINGIISGSAGINKFGTGTLELGGSSGNTLNSTTVVWDGMLELNKTIGVALNGSLTVGDHIGASNTDMVKFLGSNQISTTAAVVLNSTASLDLNGFDQTTGAVTLFVGPQASSSLSTGAGTLTMNGNLTLSVIRGGTTTAVPATISGNLAIGGASARTLTVDTSQAAEELTISAVVSDAAAGWTKAGSGRLALTN
ncbi:MAG: autotransporter-associated beta strand repeat-containing protein, partial [Verrucomicrobiae bacterium]|nr:autotransporter-associated beta strand repeat-containing protein [Verrucomicrobiae bacterium]